MKYPSASRRGYQDDSWQPIKSEVDGLGAIYLFVFFWGYEELAVSICYWPIEESEPLMIADLLQREYRKYSK